MKKHFILFAAVALSLSSCMMSGTRGSGHVVSKTYTETDFKNIDISSVMKVYLKQGDQYEVRIDAEDNLQDLIEVKKEGDKLSFGLKNHTSINPTKDIIIYITAPDFHKLEASGAGGFVSQSVIKTNEILLDLSGATKVKLDLDVTNIKVDASGATEIVLSGQSNTLEIDGSGSTDVKAFDLKSQSVDIDISGAGGAEVQAEKALKVEISGAGDVSYKGNPSITKEIHGAGKIKAASN
jgi:hypothetical protein